MRLPIINWKACGGINLSTTLNGPRMIYQRLHQTNRSSGESDICTAANFHWQTQQDYCEAELAAFRYGNVFRTYARDAGCAVRTIPSLRSKKACSAIGEKLFELRRTLSVTQVKRTAPPAITELWEIMPAETRTQVEADIQRWTPPKRGQVSSFLNCLRVVRTL